MALKVEINYKEIPVVYDVTRQQDDVYSLRLNQEQRMGDEYIPSKIVIRKKGKIWISDIEDYPLLVSSLLTEIKLISVKE